MDAATAERVAAEELVKCWLRDLTTSAQEALSEHDVDAIISIMEQALAGELAFLLTHPDLSLVDEQPDGG